MGRAVKEEEEEEEERQQGNQVPRPFSSLPLYGDDLLCSL